MHASCSSKSHGIFCSSTRFLIKRQRLEICFIIQPRIRHSDMPDQFVIDQIVLRGDFGCRIAGCSVEYPAGFDQDDAVAFFVSK